MPNETIVAVYETAVAADAAIAGLMEAGVPEHAIQHYADASYGTRTGTETTADATAADRPGGGLWGWITGEKPDAVSHHAEYERSISGGRNVVTVIADETQAERIIDLLERHSPVDLEEHGAAAAGYPAAGTAANRDVPAAGTPIAHHVPAAGTTAPTGQEEVLALSEEELEVGKRVVERGTTRIRRYVVERPVEEHIRLRDETVSVLRRPISGRTPLGTDAFTDKVVEMTETDEEAVVAKKAFVAEEVVLRKDVAERDETIRDTLRKEEVEITGPGSTATPNSTTP